MSILNKLSPEAVWKYFEEICRIPRISKNEGEIRKYLLEFAKASSLESKEDKVGNILITRPASPGMESRKTVVLQSHMDMVGEKNANHPHDWLKDPITPVIKGGWVGANGTTLGADDGIGIASQMAILTDRELHAGKIECLFTVDEESGMTGAINISPDFFSGRTLLNLDSEDEGILYIGCAGGMDTVGTMTFIPTPVPSGPVALELSVTGLHGGHSGDEIHKGYGNSVKIMNRLVRDLSNTFKLSLCYFDGGNLRNAIPREAFATIVLNPSDLKPAREWITRFSQSVAAEFGDLEPELRISAVEGPVPAFAMDPASQDKFLNTLSCCPHGALAWSKDMEDLVETSTNLASAKFEGDNSIRIITTQRSSIDSSKHDAASMVESCMRLAGADVVHSDGYPGWKPNMASEILALTRNSYRRLFAREPLVRAIHAGLECGLIYEKVKGIDMISFGPTIRGAHTPEEMIEVRSTLMFWDLLTDVVRNMPVDR